MTDVNLERWAFMETSSFHTFKTFRQCWRSPGDAAPGDHLSEGGPTLKPNVRQGGRTKGIARH